MAEQKQLSLCIVTKNEEACLPACLNAIHGLADETLVVDLGSNDRTLDHARQSGTAVYQPEWADDFSKIRNVCMDHAAGKWVLFLQANETIPKEQWSQLRLLLHNPNAEGYLLDTDDCLGESLLISPTQSLRLIRSRTNYRFQYRSYPCIPEEELFSLQNSGLQIMFLGRNCNGWMNAEAARLLQLDLQEHPQDGFLWYRNGLSLFQRKRYRESAASLELARHLSGGVSLYIPHLYKCLGLCLLALDRNAAAEEALNEGGWLFPYYTDLWVLRSEVYRRMGRHAEARSDLQRGFTLLQTPNVCVPNPELNLANLEEIRNTVQTGSTEPEEQTSSIQCPLPAQWNKMLMG